MQCLPMSAVDAKDNRAYGFRDIRIDRRHGPGYQPHLKHGYFARVAVSAETPSYYWITAVAVRVRKLVRSTVEFRFVS